MELSRIVASSDFTDNSLPAVEAAIVLAAESKATLYLVHVLEIPSAVAAPTPTVQSMNRLYEAANRRLLGMIPENLPPELEIEPVVLAGVPAAAIADFAREKMADMIVVGTHGRKGLKRVFMGSTAESLLREASCQVLVVKPRSRVRASDDEPAGTEQEVESTLS